MPKRPYAAPRVEVHGTVAELTLAVKTGSQPDGDNNGSFTPAVN